jgi:hypothetical protein
MSACWSYLRRARLPQADGLFGVGPLGAANCHAANADVRGRGGSRMLHSEKSQRELVSFELQVPEAIDAIEEAT